MLEAENLTVQYGSTRVVDDVSFALAEGQWLMLVGPNGAGKSTVVGAVSGAIPYTGSVRCIGKDIKKFKPTDLARQMGVLTQSHSVGYSFTVAEVVNLGRYAYSRGLLSGKSDADDEAIAKAIELTGLQPFLNHTVTTLSGGELQRTFLAQIFAQDPKILVLDEPTNHLDLIYQKQIFELIREWLKEPNRAVISVVHDLSLAKTYGTDAILLDRGRTIASGKTDAVLSRGNLHNVYSMDVYVWMAQLLNQWKVDSSG
jgi:iron complex transport system ATP-binding protein